jgi:DNA-binding PadR family transcriptional regulator
VEIMPGDNFQYAVLGLIALKPGGVHGYQLKKEVHALCEDFWQLNYGRLYRLLDRLDAAGELEVARVVQETKPTRKVFRITDKGRHTLEDWFLQPLSDDPRPFRDELALKLLFLNGSNVFTVSDHLKRQRSLYLTKLARIARRRKRLEKAGVSSDVASLILDGAESRVESDLAWLDHVERTIIRKF